MEKQLPLTLTFNDVLLLPDYSDFTRDEINLTSKLSRNLTLKIPFVSAPMDTVTEHKLAIALASLGGVGIIHRNLSIAQQAEELRKVKKAGVLAGAAVGSGPGFEKRVQALVDVNIDVVVIDSAHGYSKFVISALKYIKKHYPKLEVIAGNVATYEGACALIEVGADALRVGMGPGAICTTRVISGMGVPQMTAIWETARAAKGKVPIIADGGIVNSGDIVKALAAGASSVMMGGFFASTVESPGRLVRLSSSRVPKRFQDIEHKRGEYLFKEYRGMGSEAAMKMGAQVCGEDEFHGKSYTKRAQGMSLVAEGAEGLVPIKGTVAEVVNSALGGIKSGLYYCGAKNISSLHKKARFIQITQQSMIESRPHDILVTNPGKNYKD